MPRCTTCQTFSSLSLRATGAFHHKRYVYKNVEITDTDTLSVFLPFLPPISQQPRQQKEEVWLNVIHDNVTEPVLPTHAMFKKTTKEIFVTRINYQEASPEHQPRCVGGWVHRPVYVMYIPHPRSMFHNIHDALMGAFQTLREEGLLPLAEVDMDAFNEETLTEFTNDIEPGMCPLEYDVGGSNRAPRMMASCRRKAKFNNMTTQPPRPVGRCNGRPLCRGQPQGGLIVTNRMKTGNGPILLLGKGSSPPPETWRHLYHAISHNIKEWDSMVGVCFKELYLGKSAMLNLYMAAVGGDDSVDSSGIDSSTSTNENDNNKAMTDQRALRREAFDAFRRVMATAQKHYVASSSKAAPWGGYAGEGMEVLRRGIGPEGVEVLQVLRDKRNKDVEMEYDKYTRDREEIRRVLSQEQSNLRRLIRMKRKQEGLRGRNTSLVLTSQPGQPSRTVVNKEKNPYLSIVDGGEVVTPRSSPRPVVTILQRNLLRRCILNEADIAEYILSLYNVTVRISHFEEPLLEVMELMNSTDVVIGMHGGAWINALFLKPGAAAVQLHPYGWLPQARIDDKSFIPIRGNSYRNMVQVIGGGAYGQWVNPYPDHAFFREEDFDGDGTDDDADTTTTTTGNSYSYSLHPQPAWPRPKDVHPGNPWIYQNTVVSMDDLSSVLDEVIASRGIAFAV